MQAANLDYQKELERIKAHWMYSDEYKSGLVDDAKAARNAVMTAEAEKIRDSVDSLKNPAEVAVLDVTDGRVMNALTMLDFADPNAAEGIVMQFNGDAPALQLFASKLRSRAAAESDSMKAGAFTAIAVAAEKQAEPISEIALDDVERMAYSILYNPDNFTTDEYGYTFGEIAVNRLMREAERTGLDLDIDPDLTSWETKREELRQSDPLTPKIKTAQNRIEATWRDEIQRFIDADQEHAGEYAKYADEQFAERPQEGYAIRDEVQEMWRGYNMISSSDNSNNSPSDE